MAHILHRGGSILSAMVTVNGGAFEPESPKEIVRTIALNYTHTAGDYQTWAVSADGKRILSLQLVGGIVQ